MKEMPYVFLFTSFFHCRSFSPGWSPTFLIFSPPLFMVLPIKNVSFAFFFYLRFSSVTLFLVELRWPVAYFLFFYIPNMCA